MGVSRVTLAADEHWSVRADDMVIHTVGEVTFLYDRLSGDTHALNIFAATMISLLTAAPSTTDALLEALRATLGLEPADLPASSFGAWLAELDDLGLVAPIPNVNASPPANPALTP